MDHVDTGAHICTGVKNNGPVANASQGGQGKGSAWATLGRLGHVKALLNNIKCEVYDVIYNMLPNRLLNSKHVI